MDYINKILVGRDLEILPKLPAESINCCITSPPYWGLRDYGIEPVIWDGDKDCKHEWGKPINKKMTGGKESAGTGTHKSGVGHFDINTNFCLKCNAWRGSLGLEPTFELYIKHLCDIFDEVKRVLRKDGTCFINLGDSYASGNRASGNGDIGNKDPKYKNKTDSDHAPNRMGCGLPSKSLCLIPQRFAIEMVNRGWILRNTIIWHKPNCMPSSAKDRFTVDFEYVYFFVKSKKYWFEQQFEELLGKDERRWADTYDNVGSIIQGNTNAGIKRTKRYSKNVNGRNKRAVWTIPTSPYSEAHFAVFPEALIEPMIKAGCPRYVCKKCGKARVKMYKDTGNLIGQGGYGSKTAVHIKASPTSSLLTKKVKEKKYIGYIDCGCNAGFEGGVVIDPFMGAGTTAAVAKKQGKRYIGIEIKQEYIDMADNRIGKIPGTLF